MVEGQGGTGVQEIMGRRREGEGSGIHKIARGTGEGDRSPGK